jgi:tryptophan-rich sensory protein
VPPPLILTAHAFIARIARDRVAGRLVLPYLGWVAFATPLNGAMAPLNGPLAAGDEPPQAVLKDAA